MRKPWRHNSRCSFMCGYFDNNFVLLHEETKQKLAEEDQTSTTRSQMPNKQEITHSDKISVSLMELR